MMSCEAAASRSAPESAGRTSPADGYIEIPADTDTVEMGTEVEVTLF